MFKNHKFWRWKLNDEFILVCTIKKMAEGKNDGRKNLGWTREIASKFLELNQSSRMKKLENYHT